MSVKGHDYPSSIGDSIKDDKDNFCYGIIKVYMYRGRIIGRDWLNQNGEVVTSPTVGRDEIRRIFRGLSLEEREAMERLIPDVLKIAKYWGLKAEK